MNWWFKTGSKGIGRKPSIKGRSRAKLTIGILATSKGSEAVMVV